MNRALVLATSGAAVAAALIAVGVLAVVDDAPAPAVAQNPTNTTAGAPTRTITVDGVGHVSGPPDTGTLNLGVQVQAPTAAEALRSATTKAQALVDTLTGAGVGKADIQTRGLNVNPTYTGPGTINGYTAGSSVTVTLHDIGKAGPVIDAATAAVGDGITLWGISFSIDDTSGLYAQAREMAVTEARTHAEQLAKAANVAVGAVVAMDESAQYLPMARDGATATTAAAASMPVEPGAQELQLSVQVVYELV
jgi:uncharacterized protein YggE